MEQRTNMAKLKILEIIDNKVLNLTSKIKASPEYVKIQDQFGNLDDQAQNTIKMLLPFVVLFIPLMISFILWKSNTSLREEVILKKNIIARAHEIINTKSSLMGVEPRVLGTPAIEQVEQFQQRIVGILNAVSIDSSKIQFSNFSSTPLSGDLLEAKIDLKFQNISNDELFGIIGTFNRNKMRVDSFTVRKNQETNLLEGLFSLIYISKDIVGE